MVLRRHCRWLGVVLHVTQPDIGLHVPQFNVEICVPQLDVEPHVPQPGVVLHVQWLNVEASCTTAGQKHEKLDFNNVIRMM